MVVRSPTTLALEVGLAGGLCFLLVAAGIAAGIDTAAITAGALLFAGALGRIAVQRLEVDEAGALVVNPFSTSRLRWADIVRVEVEDPREGDPDERYPAVSFALQGGAHRRAVASSNLGLRDREHLAAALRVHASRNGVPRSIGEEDLAGWARGR